MLKGGSIHLTMMRMMDLSIGKSKKVISLFIDELGGKIMIEFVALRTKHMHT